MLKFHACFEFMFYHQFDLLATFGLFEQFLEFQTQCALLRVPTCSQFSDCVMFFCLERSTKEVRYAIYNHTHAKTPHMF